MLRHPVLLTQPLDLFDINDPNHHLCDLRKPFALIIVCDKRKVNTNFAFIAIIFCVQRKKCIIQVRRRARNLTSLGKRLRASRERKKLTQVQAAEMLGITNVQLSRYESDTHKPDPDLLAKMASLYEVSTDYLITGDLQKEDTVSPEEQDFLNWVEKELKGTFFYDFAGSPEEMKKEMMDDLRVIWKLRKGRSEDKYK